MEETIPDDSMITCTIIDSDNPHFENKSNNKIIGCRNGRVLALCNNTVVAACSIPLLNPSEISIFCSYDPFMKYYIVQQNSSNDIVVLHKSQNSLKIVKYYENVQKLEISDFLIIGRPQVKIWFCDEMEPIITDFTDNNLNDLNKYEETQMLTYLNNKLHLMKSSLNDIRKLSEDRKLICENHFKRTNDEIKLLTLTDKPWQKIVNDRWVICIPVRNDYEHPVNNLELIINNINVREIETKIFNEFSTSPDEFYSIKDITPCFNAYVIGIVNEISLIIKEESINISCSLLYNVLDSDNFRLKVLEIPPLELNIEDLISGRLGLFSPHVGSIKIYDVITVISISEAILLELHVKSDQIGTKLNNILVNKLHFVNCNFQESFLPCFVVNPQSCSILSGFVLFSNEISSTDILYRCYPKDVKQISILKSLLKKLLSDDLLSICEKEIGSSSEEEIPILAAVNSLDDEFKNFTSVMKCAIPPLTQPMREHGKLRFTADTWRKLLNSNLQCKTDMKFQSALENKN